MSKNKSVERRSVEKRRKTDKRSSDRRSSDRKMSLQERQKKRRKRKRKRVLLLCFELFILAILCVVGYGMLKLGKLDINILNQNNLEVYKDTGPYTNIACFGLDSRNGDRKSVV